MDKLDEEFYSDLLSRHESGAIDEEEMGYLIDEHINKVNKFKKTLREKLAKRQLQRKSEVREIQHDMSRLIYSIQQYGV